MNCFRCKSAAAFVGIALGAGSAAIAAAAFTPSNLIVVAVRRGDCSGAVKLLNPDVKSNDVKTAFLAARLLDEGICVHEDPVAAAHYFARAAELGDREAALDFAMKVGLGEGTDQDYQRAGDLCRAAGIDPQGEIGGYSLGYACTLRGIAGKLLRKKLPVGAFVPMAGAVILIEFTPAGGQLRVLKTPHVGFEDTPTGSYLARPLINAKQETGNAWHNALAAVPPPDAARLDAKPVELSLDVDLTLAPPRQNGQAGVGEPFQPLLKGDLHSTTVGH